MKKTILKIEGEFTSEFYTEEEFIEKFFEWMDKYRIAFDGDIEDISEN